MSDLLLDRIAFAPKPAPLEPIPWPAGLAPTKPATLPDEIGKADVLAVTYTAAEAQALADVLTPGHPSSAWAKYTTDWAAYEDQLTWKSPARESKCLGQYAYTEVAGKLVLLFKSDLHLATDATSLPIKQLWEQLLKAVRPELAITTGTAGGVGVETVLGDVLITSAAKFNCTQAFKDEPFAQQRFEGGYEYDLTGGLTPRMQEAQDKLMPVNAKRLQPIASRDPQLILGADVETVDYFAFADTDDSYGVVKDDPQARMEEMDDAVLPLAIANLAQHYAAVPGSWLSIRNASDPQVPNSIGSLEAQANWASNIYTKYGYWTTVNSAIATWACIAE